MRSSRFWNRVSRSPRPLRISAGRLRGIAGILYGSAGGKRMAAPHMTTVSHDRGCVRLMKDFRAETPGVTSLGLVGPDGFEIASLTDIEIAVSKVAALTSTIAAVAQALTREVGLSECQ